MHYTYNIIVTIFFNLLPQTYSFIRILLAPLISSSPSHMQPPQDRLTFPLIFEWKKQGNMPYATKSDNLCIVDGKGHISDYQHPSILEYIPDTDTWMTLSTPTKGHGINGIPQWKTHSRLVGWLTNESTSHNPLAISKIRVWDSDSKQWTEPYPPMTIEHAEVECASYLHYLIIANGQVGITASRSIEILDTKSGQLFKAPPMPHSRTHT